MNFKELRDLSDFDSRLVRTFKQLFKNPKIVVEDANGGYSSPLKYTATILGVVVFVMLLSDSGLVSTYSHSSNWRVPLRLQEALKVFDSNSDNFRAITLGLGTLPGILLSSFLLYFQKSANFHFKNSLYFLSQIMIMMMVYGLLQDLFYEYSDVFLVIIISYGAYYFMKLTKPWYLAILKSLVFCVMAFMSLIIIQPMIENFYLTIFYGTKSHYELETESKESLAEQYQISEEFDFLSGVHRTDSSWFLSDNYGQIGKLNKDYKLQWKTNSKNLLIRNSLFSKKHDVLLFSGLDNNFEISPLIEIYNTSGEFLVSVILGHPVRLDYATINYENDTLIQLIVSTSVEKAEKYYLERLSIIPDQRNWKVKIDTLMSSDLAIKEIIKIDSSGYIVNVCEKDEWHWSDFGIAKYNSDFELEWYVNTYDKHSPYDPRVSQFMIVNENDIIIQYSLPNDTIEYSHVKSIDRITGEMKWENEFSIPADFSEYFGLSYDENNLYIIGESHAEITKWFWQPTFHAALVCRVNINDGNLEGYKHFGRTSFEAHSRISHSFLDEGKIYLHGQESWNEPWLLKQNSENFLWVLDVNDI